ncbi:MAG: hypothetical protein K9N48_02885, partial [Verrucomicrobia bacterium]|nr:hypothetical protein [Verrucomicrobiota bacterium]
EYVEGVFKEYRERLGVKREEGAKELKPKVFEGMAVMREQRRPALECGRRVKGFNRSEATVKRAG